MVFTDPAQMNAILINLITDAYTKSWFSTPEQMQEPFRRSPDMPKMLFHKNMTHEELWLESADKLTNTIKRIIEYAKMVPGFMKLVQDDQIILLKASK